MPEPAALTVLYIAGSGRCGSTLLARVLGEIPGYFNVGELARELAPLDDRCGCGLEFPDCPFWTAVGKRAVGGWDRRHLEPVFRLQSKVARQRYLPRVASLQQAAQADRAELGKYFANLYRAIAAESGATCVVDKSGDVLQALVLADAPGIDLRVIHLVRDARGVAYSMSRRHAASPAAADKRDFTWRISPAAAAALWVGGLREVKLLRRRDIPFAGMRYEDFVLQPREAVEQALTQLGLPVDPSGLAHIGDRRVVLPLGHQVAGNPSRFSEGELILRPDDAWRHRMSRRDRLVVTTIALPYLRRYYGQRLRA